ncbi:helix-turn-helix transcriptional regulator [Clostridium botulinum]|uniref:Helix-turn-helix transcriptional regulator n=1 Tax=Clostridium botulinum TaxID=1491 RepID=A0A846JPH0_CLOBO|nr:MULTISPECIES: helix-turn-helix transcriptional regulator [Clostridium]MBN1042911.1 XRE family transcriptional regulator [Clostridium botulinum]NFN03469.1 helix-turn-helix transcriptional regulator [Clostridium botulinum]NFN34699.1 helix-turn-helix transcriptional regulator [Clostridium botulinum]NFO28849.1 helix-turn-helix transcriptional regulator [Clostridium botulinum]NFO54000.1 helix-turn-helix transcriptional regulator [Clostridium botulinum]
MGFKERLKNLRESKGLTQKQFATEINNYHLPNNIGDNTNIYVQTVSYWENGREPNYQMLIKLASFFNVSTDYLIGKSNISDINEFDYTSSINEFNTETINKYLLDLDANEKSKFFKDISRYIYNLRLNTSLVENRSLDTNDLSYIHYLSEVTTIIDEYTEDIFKLFIDCNNGVPLLKQSLTIKDINQLSTNHTNTCVKFTNILNNIQKLCLKISSESDDIELLE